MDTGLQTDALHKKGWLDLAFYDAEAPPTAAAATTTSGTIFSRKFLVLDNGVLWVYRDNKDGRAAEHVLPLHDAELQFPQSSTTPPSTPTTAADTEATEAFVVHVSLGSGSGGRRIQRFSLRAATGEEYRRWTSAMLEAAQLWHARRQMAFMAVLPAAAGASGRCGPAQASGLAEGRRLLVQGLSLFLVQVGELRARTRRAVTRNQRHDQDGHGQDSHGADLNLPRFLRRAISDAVDKIWRACGRAYACADVLDAAENENADPLAVYDAVLVLREAVDAFVTYCSLLRDLQAMLRDGGEAHADDSLPFCPLRCMSALRDTLFSLCPLIDLPEEEARQRAALTAVDATLQRCWMELSKRPLDQVMSVPGAPGGVRDASDPPPDQVDVGGDAAAQERTLSRGSSASLTNCVTFMGSPSVRRLASRLALHRDVVRTSVRRARKRARTEGQALLPDQKLDDSLEDAADAAEQAEALEMTALTTVSPCTSGSPEVVEMEVISSSSSLAAAAATKPHTPAPAFTPAIPAQRMALSVGGSLAANVVYSPRNAVRRGWQDPALLRRRRLICSAADGDLDGADDMDVDDDDDDVFVKPDPPPFRTDRGEVKEKNAALDEGRDAFDEDSGQFERTPSVREDLGVLDIPVTPATPNGGGRRALWCETQEVQRSGLLDRLNPVESALQEAKFEVLSSEESYLRSLDMLAHRMQTIEALQDPGVISDQDRDAVTKFLDTARACSMRFVSALRALWSLDVMLRGLCTLMHKEAMPGASLQQYLVIVSLQPRAASVLAKIGSLEARQMVPLLSLPAQRASRLPLLLAAILRRLDQRTSEAVICRAALDRLNQIVFECNEALRRAEQAERMAELGRMLKVEKPSPSKKLSWNERKNSVLGRAKSFFLKSNNRFGTKTNKILTSTSSMLHLT
ncbi:Rho guanine nucleotide exchange factor 15 [Frankliniella fusca]|uniref:Rho guanine nucleotide exchange factor 15 n=1 Tax=Frankliniella fusca TaxID=407009 RepID=A0AAE1LDD6_9NEOP|nr:Rho guanine nucleotide exchange factor 15 [Frankliniella fusca]